MQIYNKDKIRARYKHLVDILEYGDKATSSAIKIVVREFGLPEETVKEIVNEVT